MYYRKLNTEGSYLMSGNSFNNIKMFFSACFFTACIFSFTIISLADTTVYIGKDRVNIANGSQNFTVGGYVTYSANNGEVLDVASMKQWVENEGVYDVDLARFLARNGTDTNQMATEWPLGDPISGGESAYIEADWHSLCNSAGKSHVYDKNSSDKFASTDMASGYNYGLMGGWLSYWFVDHRVDKFHS